MRSKTVLFGILALSALSLAMVRRSSFMEKCDESSISMISVSIGMPTEDIGSGSTIPVKFIESTNGDGYALFHGNVRHDLKIVSGELNFVLPDMHSIAMQSIDGKLGHVDDRPAKGFPGPATCHPSETRALCVVEEWQGIIEYRNRQNSLF